MVDTMIARPQTKLNINQNVGSRICRISQANQQPENMAKPTCNDGQALPALSEFLRNWSDG